MSKCPEEKQCERCEGKGWYFRVPDNFNPFLAGGFNTARAMYRVTCKCARSTRPTGGSDADA
ncbi:hypothetical protein LQT97_00775 [Brucella pseudogrignonensis]|uniref:hypothetical protein n=1 Tax=Brucella pseudogrignonensis TaxID=419475 RepID=UPI001E4D8D57|nr:hypothetical protein [Brucella pseudogrignonensis]MCD4509758.1 hypothetical protein [Brucella pseudogrignonensis]